MGKIFHPMNANDRYGLRVFSGLILLVGLFGFTVPQDRLWELFGRTTFEEKFNKTHGVYFYYPKFNTELLIQYRTASPSGKIRGATGVLYPLGNQHFQNDDFVQIPHGRMLLLWWGWT
ncbi:MAG: hypothetical protein MUE75_07410 [Algoriphagus sp.]|nr:hypothetical protein [Algoriphagus sp.]